MHQRKRKDGFLFRTSVICQRYRMLEYNRKTRTMDTPASASDWYSVRPFRVSPALSPPPAALDPFAALEILALCLKGA